MVPVTEQHAYSAARMLGRTEGLLVGISSGAALHAAMELAKLIYKYNGFTFRINK